MLSPGGRYCRERHLPRLEEELDHMEAAARQDQEKIETQDRLEQERRVRIAKLEQEAGDRIDELRALQNNYESLQKKREEERRKAEGMLEAGYNLGFQDAGNQANQGSQVLVPRFAEALEAEAREKRRLAKEQAAKRSPLGTTAHGTRFNGADFYLCVRGKMILEAWGGVSPRQLAPKTWRFVTGFIMLYYVVEVIFTVIIPAK